MMLVSDAGLSCPGLGGHPVGAPMDPDGIRPIAKPSGRPLNALQRFRVGQGYRFYILALAGSRTVGAPTDPDVVCPVAIAAHHV